MERKTNAIALHANLQGKNIVISYLLWFFLGHFGVHRFYLRRVPTGLMLAAMTLVGWATAIFLVGYAFILVVIVWWVIDAFLIPGMVEEENANAGLETSVLHFGVDSSSSDDMDALDKLHTLHQKGILSDEQYEERRAKILECTS